MCIHTTYRRGFAWFAWLAVLLFAGILSARAQDSPHGPLTIGCESCHKATSWKAVGTGAQFDHARTKFPLKGQHTAAPCRQCHATLRFTDASTNCRSCHTDIHQGELGSLCERCHSPGSWLVPDMSQRHSRTRFVLAGPHLTLPCESCHRNQQQHKYLGLPVACYGCHKPDYDASASPPHRASGFSTDCLQCHTTSALAWGYGFDHNRTPFTLTGAHPTVPCNKCHANNTFAGTPTECSQCHQLQYASARNPVHSSPSFPLDCQVCHTTSAWSPARYDHARTAFQLTGAHAAVPCAQCHINNRFAGTAATCYGCHQANFQKTINPAHVAGGFPTDCKSCHTTLAWTPATFNHATSAFPLTGAHAAVPCIQCHVNNRFTGTPTLCYDCHQANFQKTTNPAHVAGGFPTDCKTCHTTIAWAPASFNHSASAFPLTGAHVTVPCVQCHVNNRYTGTATICYNCHQATFQKTTNPAHVAGGFPTDCKTCHNTIAWQPYTYNHDPLFPISAGSKHSPGRWSTCGDCHTSPTNFKVFACVNCHAHLQPTMDSKHSGVRNYKYDSQSCYSCHPRGIAG